MTPEQESRLEKIRALLAKAEGTKFPEEAKAFSEKAQELMAKWSIDDAMLRAAGQDASRVEVIGFYIEANEYRAPKVQLLNRIAIVNDCKLVLFTQHYRMVEGKRKRMFRVEVVGYKDDAEFVETMYTSLLMQANIEYLTKDVQAAMQLECLEGGHRIRWRNSYMNAYGQRIEQRLREAKERAKRDAATQYGSSMAMVLVGKSALVQRKFDELYPKLGTAKKSDAGQNVGTSSYHGHSAANRADLGGSKLGNKSTKQIE